jgi:hypothetical protein
MMAVSPVAGRRTNVPLPARRRRGNMRSGGTDRGGDRRRCRSTRRRKRNGRVPRRHAPLHPVRPADVSPRAVLAPMQVLLRAVRRGRPGALRSAGVQPWDKNPNLCRRCITSLNRQEVSGAEIEASFLFAEVRRSSDLARSLGTMEFTRLMQRFYAAAQEALIADEASIEKFVRGRGGRRLHPAPDRTQHAAAAVRAAEHLLLETGHGEAGGPWLPLGAGVHTGRVRGHGLPWPLERHHGIRRSDQRRRARVRRRRRPARS